MIIGNMKPCPFCGRVIDIDSVPMELRMGPVMKMRFTCLCGITFEIEDDELYYDNRGMPHQLGRTAFDKWNTRVEPQAEDKAEGERVRSVVRDFIGIVESMRNPTEEEKESVNNYLESISKPTGVNIFDMMDELQTERIK